MKDSSNSNQSLFQMEYKKPICSPMNYTGGKYKLLPQILPIIPEGIKVFVDLFCGGCNVGINVKSQKVVFNDNLKYLIDLYRKFYTLSTDEVLSHILRRINEFSLSQTNDQGYKQLRSLYNEKRNALDLFVLVAYSFNHQIRFNTAHEFNNPFGKERSSFNKRMEENLIAFLNEMHEREIEFSIPDYNRNIQ